MDHCKAEGIDYVVVNPYSTDLVREIADCDAFFWHFMQEDYKNNICAKAILRALEDSGKAVFPNSRSAWHFDDKLSQKYIFEALDIPHVPSYVFYTKEEALQWIEGQTLPVVFKLRGGAGSSNVKLIRTRRQARQMIKKSFGKGHKTYAIRQNAQDKLAKMRRGQITFGEILRKVPKLFTSLRKRSFLLPEKGYVYFQKFIPDNAFDIRVIVTGDRAFAIKRLVRDGDFRASGSGNIRYDREEIPEECVRLAFEINEKVQSQSLALDFVFDAGRPLVVEMSYGYWPNGYDACPGYWTRDLTWHPGPFSPYAWQIENLLATIG